MSDFGPKTAFKIVDGIRDKVRAGAEHGCCMHSGWMPAAPAQLPAPCCMGRLPACRDRGRPVPACPTSLAAPRRPQVMAGQLKTGDQIRAELKASIAALLAARGGSTELALPEAKPAVLLVVGVNGGGKTTTIGKLANKFAAGAPPGWLAGGRAHGLQRLRPAEGATAGGGGRSAGVQPGPGCWLAAGQRAHSPVLPLPRCLSVRPSRPPGGAKVVLAAGDTFRAAAAEQLEEWARRSGAEIVRAQVRLGCARGRAAGVGGGVRRRRCERCAVGPSPDCRLLSRRIRLAECIAHGGGAAQHGSAPFPHAPRLPPTHPSASLQTHPPQGDKVRPDTVLYQAVDKAVQDGADLVLCDTSGRLHTNWSLMVRRSACPCCCCCRRCCCRCLCCCRCCRCCRCCCWLFATTAAALWPPLLCCSLVYLGLCLPH